MGIASFKKKLESFDLEIEDENGELATFILMPLPSDLMQMVNVFITGGGELLSQAQKLRYVKDCLVGWSGVKDEEGKDLPYSKEMALQLITQDYDDLLTVLITSSYEKKIKRKEKLEEDKENLGKS